MSFDYKKYSLEKLEDWMHDVLSADNTSAQEIYDCIWNVVTENYYYHKHQLSRTYELMEKLSDNLPYTSKMTKVEENNQYTDEELNAMCDAAAHADTISTTSKKTWVLPVEEFVDDDTYETDYRITFPQEMLELTGWVEGDQLEWIDRKDGTFQIRKMEELK